MVTVTTVRTTTTTAGTVPAIGINAAHLRSVQGILKFLEIICCLVVIIVLFIEPMTRISGDDGSCRGFVLFFGFFGLICSFLFLIFYCTNCIFHTSGLPIPLIMFLLWLLITICALIAACLSIWRTDRWFEYAEYCRIGCNSFNKIKIQWMVAAIASILAFIFYLIDTIFYFSAWRKNVIQTTISRRR